MTIVKRISVPECSGINYLEIFTENPLCGSVFFVFELFDPIDLLQIFTDIGYRTFYRGDGVSGFRCR